ncbi:hypothetical protein OCAR_6013 [Afipia carboxidovorans OM5]|nr:hypothetical protein OCAR_6013 [Afipia carboxidovorans OM5]
MARAGSEQQAQREGCAYPKAPSMASLQSHSLQPRYLRKA